MAAHTLRQRILTRPAAAVAASGLALVLVYRWHRRYTQRGVEIFRELLVSDVFGADCRAVHAYGGRVNLP